MLIACISWQASMTGLLPIRSESGPTTVIPRAQNSKWIWIVKPISVGDTMKTSAMAGMFGWYWSVQD